MCNVVLDEFFFVDAHICLHPPNARFMAISPCWEFVDLYSSNRFPNTIPPIPFLSFNIRTISTGIYV